MHHNWLKRAALDTLDIGQCPIPRPSGHSALIMRPDLLNESLTFTIMIAHFSSWHLFPPVISMGTFVTSLVEASCIDVDSKARGECEAPVRCRRAGSGAPVPRPRGPSASVRGGQYQPLAGARTISRSYSNKLWPAQSALSFSKHLLCHGFASQ